MLARAGGTAVFAAAILRYSAALAPGSFLGPCRAARRRLQMEGNWGGAGGRVDEMRHRSSPPSASASSVPGGSSPRGRGRGGRGLEAGAGSDRQRRRGGGEPDRIDALGRLLTRILRHMASELNLEIRSDGYVRVSDLLKMNLTTYAKLPLRSHTIDDIKEAVRRDNKQRFNLSEDNGELWIRANQGHTITTISSESLLKPIIRADEFPVCVHGTYKRNLQSILQGGLKRMSRIHVHFSCGLPTDGLVISGMRRDVNLLIFLDVKRALQEGMKLYISDNRVILTEGFAGVVPVNFFERIETWPEREPVPFSPPSDSNPTVRG